MCAAIVGRAEEVATCVGDQTAISKACIRHAFERIESREVESSSGLGCELVHRSRRMRAAEFGDSVDIIPIVYQQQSERSDSAVRAAGERVDDVEVPRPAKVRELEDYALRVCAAVRCCSVQPALLVERDAAAWAKAVVAAREIVEHALTSLRQFVDDSASVAGACTARAARGRRSKEVTVAVERHAAVRILAVRAAREIVED